MGFRIILFALFFGTSPAGANALDSVFLLSTGPTDCAAALVGQNGVVVTANHCVTSRRPLILIGRDGRRRSATLIASDRTTDVALLYSKSLEGVTGLRIRQHALIPGEEVVVHGHPLVSLSRKIPALRSLLAFSRFEGHVSVAGEDLVQLDVAFNPGVSGGPILDEEGFFCGVASRKLRGEHLSFAATVEPVIRLRNTPRVEGLTGRVTTWWEFHAPLWVGGSLAVAVRPQLELWDRVGLEATVLLPIGSRWQAIDYGEASWYAARAGIFGRYRIGAGGGSVALDIGAHGAQKRILEAAANPDQIAFTVKVEPLIVGGFVRVVKDGWAVTATFSGLDGEVDAGLSIGRPLLGPGRPF